MMKRIVCFGDSNTWGYDAQTDRRFPEGVRWTSLLAEKLPQYRIVEEGLSGRTSVCDDPLFEGLNGLTYITPCLMSQSPIELVIIMLGTNDTKERFHLTSYNIAQGIVRLAQKANTLDVFQNDKPHVLVIAPPVIGASYRHTSIGDAMGDHCDEKSEQLANHLQQLLKDTPILFLNSSEEVSMNEIDYMHLNEEGHELLAQLVFNKINPILQA